MENVLELWDNGDKNFKSKAYKSVCALLNSHGGKLILNTELEYDKIIRQIEQHCENFLGTSGVIQKLGKISITSNQYTLEVKENDALCTMNYNLYLPSNTQTMLVRPLERVKKVKEILNTDRMVDITETDKNVPTEFILDSPIGIRESKTVQFKHLESDKKGNADLASRLESNKLTHYVSAFANRCGGRLYCGVDNDGIVKGQIVKNQEKEELTRKVTKYINKMIWPEYCCEPQMGKHGQWDISFEPVTDDKGNPILSTFVIVIFVAACPGGVFTSEPESYHIVDGKATRMTFAEWKRKLLNPTRELETAIAPRVPQVCWSSPNLKRRCDLLDGELLRIINNGQWNRFDRYVTKLQNNTPDVEERLILIAKWLMFHYRKSQFKEAEDCLSKYENCLSTAKDVLIFEVRGRLVRSTMERSRGNHKKSYEITRDCLSKVEQIAPSILTVEFYAHFGTMLTIMESNKDLNDLPKEDLITGSFKDEAIFFYDKTLQHLQEADYVPKSKADMQQKTLINEAYTYLGCSLSGDVVKHSKVSEEDIIKADACIKRAYASSGTISSFRECHLNFAESCCSYRKSQLEPSEEERIDLLDYAIRKVIEAERRANDNNFDELSRYARNHAEVFKKELETPPAER